MRTSITIQQLEVLNPCGVELTWRPLLEQHGSSITLEQAVAAGVSERDLWWLWVCLDRTKALLALIKQVRRIVHPHPDPRVGVVLDTAESAVIRQNPEEIRAAFNVVKSAGGLEAWAVALVVAASGAPGAGGAAFWAAKVAEMMRLDLPPFIQVYQEAYA